MTNSEEDLIQATITVEKKIVGCLEYEAEGRKAPGLAYASRKKCGGLSSSVTKHRMKTRNSKI